jgi:translation elongation factor P/translation initiation factor 5A
MKMTAIFNNHRHKKTFRSSEGLEKGISEGRKIQIC